MFWPIETATRPDSSTYPYPYLILSILVALCFDDKKLYTFRCQTFEFHNLFSLVPVKGIVLFNFVVGVISFFLS